MPSRDDLVARISSPVRLTQRSPPRGFGTSCRTTSFLLATRTILKRTARGLTFTSATTVYPAGRCECLSFGSISANVFLSSQTNDTLLLITRHVYLWRIRFHCSLRALNLCCCLIQAYCGNISAQPATCFSGSPLCQHGANECTGDRLEACAASGLSNKVSALQSAEFAYCLEAGGLDVGRAESCALSSGIDWNALDSCAASESPEGDAANVVAANITAQYTYVYSQGWAGTPTVVLNGETLFTTKDLLGQVCAAAGADAPVGCSTLRQNQPEHSFAKC